MAASDQMSPILAVAAEWPLLKVKQSVKDVSAVTSDLSGCFRREPSFVQL